MSYTKTNRFKRFFSYYKPYRLLFIADITCAVIVAGIALFIPLCTRYITKEVLEKGFQNASLQILMTGGVMIFLTVAQSLCTYVYDAKGHTMGAKMERDMRLDLFEKIQKLPFGFFDDQKPGKLMARITNDLLELAELYHHAPEDLIIYLVKFIGTFIILFCINVRLALILLLVMPVVVLYTVFFGRRLRKIYKESYERIGDVNAQVEDSLSGIRVVKSFVNGKLELKKFGKENNRFLASRENIYKNESVLYVGITAFTQLLTIVTIVFGGLSILDFKLDLPDLITFLLYLGYLAEPIPQLVRIMQQYQEGIAGFNRFMDIMELSPEVQCLPDSVPLGKVQGNIEFRDVGFRYKKDMEYVLKHISFTVKAGDYVALVGSSGVGKTTFCSLLPRFYDVSEGQITLDGKDIRRVQLDELRSAVGFVQQEVYLFAGTVFENIAYGRPDASSEEVIAAAKKANAHEFIMALPNGYETDIGHRGVKLSGGQKQRISIARIFLKDPAILILDEATSALDSESEKAVQESMAELAKNRTTFVIAHRLSTIRHADQIVVLTDKGIAEKGTHEELLLLNGEYAKFYRIQVS